MNKKIFESLIKASNKVGEASSKIGESAKAKYGYAKDMVDLYGELNKEDQAKFREELIATGKKYFSDKIESVKKAGAVYSELKKKAKEQRNETVDEVKEDMEAVVNTYDSKILNFINEHAKKVDDIQKIFYRYQYLEEKEQMNFYNCLCELFSENKKALDIYNNLKDVEKEKYFTSLNETTIRLHDIIYRYNNEFNHDKYNDYVSTYSVYDKVVDIFSSVIGIVDNEAHLFNKKIYTNEKSKNFFFARKEDYSKYCIYVSDDGLTSIYVDSDNQENYVNVKNGFSYVVSNKNGNNKVYTSNCALDSTIDYDRERFEMYNQELVIAPYFEKGKATKEEVEKVLDYVSEKYQLSKKDNVKKK